MFGQTPGRKYHWLKLWHYTGSEIVDNSLEREKKEVIKLFSVLAHPHLENLL
jgi:hypothetical protein